jgi:hypothetical protein
MSWIDNVENTIFTIRTGDGKIYTPDLPINYETLKEFNTATFEFIDVPGALITRKLQRARKFPLVFYFQGENNIDVANAFDTSSNDPRAWVVRHPQYGDITGQPISIRRDDSKLNATEITVDFWETIVTTFPQPGLPDPTGEVVILTTYFSTVSPVNYASKVKLKPKDLAGITNFANSLTALVKKGMDTLHAAEFIADVNQMMNAINNIILAPAAAISAIHQVCLLPAKLELSVALRIEMIGAIYNSVATILSNQPTVNNKAFFETAGGICVCSMAQSITSPLAGDYITRNQVAVAQTNLISMYNDSLATLDASYVELNTIGSAFTASQESQTALQDVYLSTLTNLYTLALGAKQERQVMLEKDGQLIVLAHKYMSGLDQADANIETFRTINNFKNNYLFLIPKGTQVKYYV